MKALRFFLPVIVFPMTAMAEHTLRIENVSADFITQGYGEPQVGKTVEGAPLVIAGVAYQNGLGTHAKSTIPILLDGSAARFTAFAGLPDSVIGTAAKVEFRVIGDGKELWKSGPVLPGEKAREISLDLTGVKKLQLVVTDGENGNTSDHAIWADAKIVSSGAMPEVDGNIIRLPLGETELTLREKDGILLVFSFGKKGANVFSGPAYPTTTDLHHRAAPVRVTHADGSEALDLRYVSHRRTTKGNTTALDVLLRDKVRPFEVTLHYLAHQDSGVLEQWVTARNTGGKPVRIGALASAFLPFASDGEVYADFYSSKWADEMRRISTKLSYGQIVQENRTLCRHVTGAAPHFVISLRKPATEETGVCVLGSLAWTGNSRLLMEKGPEGGADFIAGVLPEGGAFTLDPGASLDAPRLILACSANGLSAASRALHRWARESGGIREGSRPRYIDNNSWEGAYFDVGEKRLLAMIDGSAKLGVELYLLDDGWFGHGDNARNDSNAGLGDWQLNTKKIPSLDTIIEACEARSMKFGIWVEPEMVNERSNLFAAHPEWALRYPDREPFKNRNQLVLDLANPAVQEFVFKSVDDILVRYPKISYIKWDANSDANAPWSNFLGPQRQGDLPWKYMAGYYAVMKRLTEKHPSVIFQACAAGGGRADYGALSYSHTFWPSDNTSPGYRLKATWSYSTFFPALAITSHVTHSGGKGYSPKYRMDISFFGQFGLEVDPAHLDDAYRACVTTAIADYKKVRDVIQFGDQYRTLSPFVGPVAAVNYVSPDKSRAVLLGYRPDQGTPQEISLPLRGLDAGKTYRLREMNLASGERPRLAAKSAALSGADLLKNGLPADFQGANDSISVELTAE